MTEENDLLLEPDVAKLLNRLRGDSEGIDASYLIASIAISLRRIADTLDQGKSINQ